MALLATTWRVLLLLPPALRMCLTPACTDQCQLPQQRCPSPTELGDVVPRQPCNSHAVGRSLRLDTPQDDPAAYAIHDSRYGSVVHDTHVPKDTHSEWQGA